MPALLLGLHAAAAVLAPLLARRLRSKVLLVCGIAPAVTTVWALAQMPAVVGRGEAVDTQLAWVPSVGLTADLRLDAFTLLMVLLVSGIGTLIFAFAASYFARSSKDLALFAAALTGFAGAMLGLVLADNLILLFVFWEATSITSFLLIGTNDRDPRARASAVQALLTTGAGGLALLAGLVVLAEGAGTYSLSQMLSRPPTGASAAWGVGLVLLGAFTKSAQAPFHFWLPAAMAAPTPVSAYLHSATMVKAGVFVVARFAPVFAVVPLWRPLVLGVGVVTMLLGAVRALRQHDLKLLLAYGTVSQLGFLTVVFGLGTPEATFAATVLLLAHAMFKAALFMVVGAIDVQMGSRDIRELRGVRHRMPLAFATAVVAAASMAGLPPLLGFIAKEAAFDALLVGEYGPLGPVAVVGIVAGSALTVAYSARFLRGAFSGAPQETTAPERRALTAPASVLALGTLALGLLPLAGDALLNAAATALDPRWAPKHLSLWHGLNLALALSALAVAVGLGLHAIRGRVEQWQAAVSVPISAARGYDVTWRAVLGLARRTTGVMQTGSLPVYLVVILATGVTLPAVAFALRGTMPQLPRLAENPLQAALCVLAIAAAIGVTLAARRFAAVLLLGAVGYSVAALFVLHGAPDLALTQLLIETLSLVIFVLVLRHLPARFGRRPQPIDRVVRVAAAVVVGVAVFAFALITSAARTAAPVSDQYVARALPEAQGRNVVNVILVDFRALDTLGEIVVLATAAMGIASLVAAARAGRGDESPAEEGRT